MVLTNSSRVISQTAAFAQASYMSTQASSRRYTIGILRHHTHSNGRKSLKLRWKGKRGSDQMLVRDKPNSLHPRLAVDKSLYSAPQSLIIGRNLMERSGLDTAMACHGKHTRISQKKEVGTRGRSMWTKLRPRKPCGTNRTLRGRSAILLSSRASPRRCQMCRTMALRSNDVYWAWQAI